MWLCTGLSGFNLLLLILLYPESNFQRPAPDADRENSSLDIDRQDESLEAEAEKPIHEHRETMPTHSMTTTTTDLPNDATIHGSHSVSISDPTFKQILTTVKIDHETSILRIAFQPFIFCLSPTVIWAFCAYSVSLSAQIIMMCVLKSATSSRLLNPFIFSCSYNLPSFMIPPPYLFTAGDVGLMQIAAIVGFIFATLAGGWLSDVITARQIKRAGGNLVAEQRLISLLPFCWVAPLACLLTGYGASKFWPWYGIAITFGMRESR